MIVLFGSALFPPRTVKDKDMADTTEISQEAARKMLAALREAYLSLECRPHTSVVLLKVRAAINAAEGR